jgi:hypothetical protein
MTVRTPDGPGIGCLSLLLCIVLLTPVSGTAATTPIYKCLDGNLGLVYTDEPCKGGELMNIRAGDADPVAVARMERVRDALDQSVAQRIADQRHAADQRNLAAWYARENEPIAYDNAAAYTPYDYGAIGWSPRVGRHPPLRTRPPKLPEARHVAPRSTHMVARR